MKTLVALLLLACGLSAQTTIYVHYAGADSIIPITNCTNAAPMVCTTKRAHGYTSYASSPGSATKVFIQSVSGNTAANTCWGNSCYDYFWIETTPTTTTFTLGLPDHTQVDGNGAYVVMTGSGTQGQVGTGHVGAVRETTLVSGPRGLLDGTGGTITTRATDPDGAGAQKAPHAITGFLPWDAIKAWNPTGIANYNNATGLGSVSETEQIWPTALAWLGDQSDTAKLTAVKYWVNNIEAVWMTRSSSAPYFGACDYSKTGCGIYAPDTDFRSIQSVGSYYSYAAIRSQLSAPERQAFADKVFNGAFGEAHTNRLRMQDPSRVNVDGTAMVCVSGTCAFDTIPSPAGRFIYVRTTVGTYGQWSKIASVTDANNLVLTAAFGGTADSNDGNEENSLPWGWVADWTATSPVSTGDLMYQWTHPYSASFQNMKGLTRVASPVDADAGDTVITVVNANNIPVIDGDQYCRIGGDLTHEWVKLVSRSGNDLTVIRGALYSTLRAVLAPAIAANPGTGAAPSYVFCTVTPNDGGGAVTTPNAAINQWETYQDAAIQNLTWTKIYNSLIAADVLADDDERARKMLQVAWNYWYAYLYTDAKDRWTGITQGGYSYTHLRWQHWFAETAFIGKYHFSPAVDVTDGVWMKNQGDIPAHLMLPQDPTQARAYRYGEAGSEDILPFRQWRYLMLHYYLFDAADEAQKGWFWLKNVAQQFTLARLGSPDNFQMAPISYLFLPPTATCTSPSYTGCIDYRDTANLTRFYTGDLYDRVNTPQHRTEMSLVSSRPDWSENPNGWVVCKSLSDPNDHLGTPPPGECKIQVNRQWVEASGPSTRNDNNYGQAKHETGYQAIDVADSDGISHFGNGTIVWPADAIGEKVIGGRYILTCVTEVANGGIFSITSPYGELLPDVVTVGVEHTISAPYGPITFTINDGSNDYQTGDTRALYVYLDYTRFSQSNYLDIAKGNPTVQKSVTHGVAVTRTTKNRTSYYGNWTFIDKKKTDSSYAFWRLNLYNAYQGFAFLNRYDRHHIHFRGTENYFVMYDGVNSTNTVPKEEQVQCYTDDGAFTYTLSSNQIDCVRTQSKIQTLVLLPTDTSKITQRNLQLLDSISVVYSSSSSSQRPNGSLRVWTLVSNIAWPLALRVSGVRKTWGIIGEDTGKQWYWEEDGHTVRQCDNSSVSPVIPCPGAQETAPASNDSLNFEFYADKSVGFTIADTGTANEFLTVRCMFAATTGDCPTTSTLSTISSNSRGVLINHASRPKVAIFDNNAGIVNATGLVTAYNTAVTFTLSGLSAAAEIVVTGLDDGSYDVKKNGSDIYTAVTVTEEAGVLQIPAAGGHSNGDYEITKVGESPAIDITTSSPIDDGEVGTAYSKTFTVSGGTAPFTWTRIGGDAWPTGLSFSTGGALTGTPTVPGPASVQVQVCDVTPICTNKFLAITIATGVTPVAWTDPDTFPDDEADTAYPTTLLEAAGGTGTLEFTLIEGTLPDGLTQTTTTHTGDTISGTLTDTSSGSYSLTFQVCDDASTPDCDERTFNFQITATNSVELLSPTSPISCTHGVVCSAEWHPAPDTGTPPYTFELASGLPPPGMALQLDGSISGIPNISPPEEDYCVRVRITGSGGSTAVDQSDVCFNVTKTALDGGATASVELGDVGGKFTLHYPGLDANAVGAVEIKTTDEVTIGGCYLLPGPALRQCGVNTLTANTTYNFDFTIGGEYERVQATTLPTIGGTAPLILYLYQPAANAEKVKVYYQTDGGDLEETAITACTGSCQVTLSSPPLTRGRFYGYAVHWYTSGDVEIPTTILPQTTRLVLVQ